MWEEALGPDSRVTFCPLEKNGPAGPGLPSDCQQACDLQISFAFQPLVPLLKNEALRSVLDDISFIVRLIQSIRLAWGNFSKEEFQS